MSIKEIRSVIVCVSKKTQFEYILVGFAAGMVLFWYTVPLLKSFI